MTQTTTKDLSWITPGQGAYLCTEHRLQFRTVKANHDHLTEAHPDKLRTVTAR